MHRVRQSWSEAPSVCCAVFGAVCNSCELYMVLLRVPIPSPFGLTRVARVICRWGKEETTKRKKKKGKTNNNDGNCHRYFKATTGSSKNTNTSSSLTPPSARDKTGDDAKETNGLPHGYVQQDQGYVCLSLDLDAFDKERLMHQAVAQSERGFTRREGGIKQLNSIILHMTCYYKI